MDKFNLTDKFALFSEHWRPKVAGELNGQELKLVKAQGTFVWHSHEHEDEFFMVWRGRLRIETRERVFELATGDCLVVPRGVEHRTAADEEVEVLIFSPAAMRNTGDVEDAALTAPTGAKI